MAVRERLTPQGRRFYENVKKLKKKPHVVQGYPREVSTTNEKHEDSDLSVLFVAIIHEFGTGDGRVPERSHIRASFDAMRPKLERFVKKEAMAILDGARTVEQALDRIGLFMVNEHKAFIKKGIGPALSPNTRPNQTNKIPLIDTAQMLNSSTFKRRMKS